MSGAGSQGARFLLGSWTVDPQAGTLAQDDRSVRLEPKVMAVLLHLVERAGEVASKEEIIQAVWADTFVGEAALSRCISELRRELGDDARAPRFIETLPKRGYRLLVPVDALAPDPVADGASDRRWPAAIAVAMILVVVAVWWSRRPTGSDRIESVAVLPLRALSADPEQRFFAEGLSELLIARLAAIERLRVVSALSARQARDADAALRDIAAALGVDAVIDGSIQRAGDRIVVSLELASATADELVWAGSYREIGEDWLEVQQEVAAQAAREIELTLAARDAPRPPARVAAPEARQALDRARRLAARGNPVDAVRSLDLLRQALEIDPDHAPTWVALADVHALLAWHNWSEPVGAYAESRAAAHAALDRDPTLAEAHALLAAVAAEMNQDWPEAERRFRTAIDLDPQSAYVRERYGRHLRRMGRVEEAIEHSAVALGIDAESPAISISHAWNLILGGRTAEARSLLDDVLQMEQDLAHAYAGLCALDNLGARYAAAVASCGRAAAVPGHGVMLGALGYAWGRRGDVAEATAVLAEIEAMGDPAAVALAVATVHVGLGAPDTAIDVVERAVAMRSLWAASMLESPYLSELRDRPRFRALLRQLFIVEEPGG